MDQIYIPKNRDGFAQGTFVLIRPIKKPSSEKLFFYNLPKLEPIKISIIKQAFQTIEKAVDFENIFITGSFLEPGFKFNDIDILIISEKKLNTNNLENKLKKEIGPDFHLIELNMKTLLKSIETDPLFRYMLNKYVSRKRFIHNKKTRLNHKLLDLHLLKSHMLINNYKELTGYEKYKLTRNLVAISCFIKNLEIKNIDIEIEKIFGRDIVNNLKNNLDTKGFKEKYLRLYDITQKIIFQGIKHGSKQK